MKNVALGQEEIPFCALSLLTMTSLRNPWEIEVADPTPETHTQVAGVDVGVRYLAVTSTTKGEATFHTGKSIVPKANHYARLRKRLQKKGTRSATRRLVVISRRDRRLTADANHMFSTS